MSYMGRISRDLSVRCWGEAVVGQSSDRVGDPSREQGNRVPNQRPPGIRAQGSSPRHAAENVRNNYERYSAMAREAASRGDVIGAENFYQHAEHYLRVMREQRS